MLFIIIVVGVLVAGEPSPQTRQTLDTKKLNGLEYLQELPELTDLAAALLSGSAEASGQYDGLIDLLDPGEKPWESAATVEYLVALSQVLTAAYEQALHESDAGSRSKIVELLGSPRGGRGDAWSLVLARAWRPGSSADARSSLLTDLLESVRSPAPAGSPVRTRIDYGTFEALARQWGLLQRPTAELELSTLRTIRSGGLGSVRASMFSLPSSVFGLSEASAFLSSLARLRPDRTLLVLSDGELLDSLRSAHPGVVFIDTAGRGYSPWPRDALTLGFDEEARPVFLLRPNQQHGRELDAEMARLLLAALPEDDYDALGRPHWAVAPVPFHNGQILEADEALWISVHTLERRILELLGQPSMTSELLTTQAGNLSYLEASRAAAAELKELFGQHVAFVHPLPATGDMASRTSASWLLGGGAGFDIDSLLTILPRAGDLPRAFVADVQLGTQLVQQSATEELEAMADVLGLRRQGLAGRLQEFARGPKATQLQTFLDVIAEHLSQLGLQTERLPLVLAPADVRLDGLRQDFVVGWQNVVLERGSRGNTAEGFASGLDRGDQLARAAYRSAGYQLDLLPTLPASVLGNGGYRCASNHLRRPRQSPEPAPTD